MVYPQLLSYFPFHGEFPPIFYHHGGHGFPWALSACSSTTSHGTTRIWAWEIFCLSCKKSQSFGGTSKFEVKPPEMKPPEMKPPEMVVRRCSIFHWRNCWAFHGTKQGQHVCASRSCSSLLLLWSENITHNFEWKCVQSHQVKHAC